MDGRWQCSLARRSARNRRLAEGTVPRGTGGWPFRFFDFLATESAPAVLTWRRPTWTVYRWTRILMVVLEVNHID